MFVISREITFDSNYTFFHIFKNIFINFKQFLKSLIVFNFLQKQQQI